MLRGLQSAASGMIAQHRRQDALSHNLANMNTSGFKKDQTVLRAFPEMLLHSIRDGLESPPQVGELSTLPALPGQSTYIGSLNTGVYNQEFIPDFAAGTPLETGNAFDFAIADQDLPQNEMEGRHFGGDRK